MSSTTREIHTTVTVSPELTRSSIRHYFWRHVGLSSVSTWLLLTVLEAFLLEQGERSWVVGAFGAVDVLLPALWICSCIFLYQRAISRIRQMDSPEVHYSFTDEKLANRSDLGAGVVPWRMVDRLYCYRDMWHLMVGPRDYVYLPTDQVDASTLFFVREQVLKNGGKVIGR